MQQNQRYSYFSKPIPLLHLAPVRYASFIMKKNQFIVFLLFQIVFWFNCQSQSVTISLDSNVMLKSTIIRFDANKHKIDSCDSGLGWKGICLIDNEPIFGTDWEMPVNEFKELSIVINDSIISLNTKYMYNPNFSGDLNKYQFKFIKGEIAYYLYGFFSDGAGTYGACWQIIKNKAFRTVITKDEWFFPMFEHLK
jgi:hypothetical protein